HVGQRLKIADKNRKPSTIGLRTYLVKRGDTAFKIAKEYRMPLEQLLQLNGLSPRSKIYPNQQLYIR
ncbi:MAG: LysM domain-containing protein, partial [Desulfobacterales bacterium]